MAAALLPATEMMPPLLMPPEKVEIVSTLMPALYPPVIAEIVPELVIPPEKFELL